MTKKDITTILGVSIIITPTTTTSTRINIVVFVIVIVITTAWTSNSTTTLSLSLFTWFCIQCPAVSLRLKPQKINWSHSVVKSSPALAASLNTAHFPSTCYSAHCPKLWLKSPSRRPVLRGDALWHSSINNILLIQPFNSINLLIQSTMLLAASSKTSPLSFCSSFPLSSSLSVAFFHLHFTENLKQAHSASNFLSFSIHLQDAISFFFLPCLFHNP